MFDNKPPPPPSFDPTHDLPADIVDKIDECLEKTFVSTPKELMLERDTTVPHGQDVAVISFCGPTLPQKHESFCLKIKGVYANETLARTAAKKMQAMDSTFILTIVPLGEWGVYPPDLERIQDQVYVDGKLHDIIDAHDREQEKARLHHEARTQLLKSNVDINTILKDRQAITPDNENSGIEESKDEFEEEPEPSFTD